LELKNIKSSLESSTFTPRENAEFDYIYKQLNTPFDIFFEIYTNQVIKEGKSKDITLGVERYKTSLLNIVVKFLESGYLNFDEDRLGYFAYQYLIYPKIMTGFATIEKERSRRAYPNFARNLTIEFTKYGLCELNQREEKRQSHFNSSVRTTVRNEWVFTPKMYRFQFWLQYNKYTNENFALEFVEFIEKKD
jgi:hypothetical protein